MHSSVTITTWHRETFNNKENTSKFLLCNEKSEKRYEKKTLKGNSFQTNCLNLQSSHKTFAISECHENEIRIFFYEE